MSRRSAVATLVRVAALQEAVARAAAGKALAAVAGAHDDHARAAADLADAGLAGGTRAALESTTQVRLWRADLVGQASAAVTAAEAERGAALAAWTEARRKHRLFEQLAARKAEEARVARERAEQALADELAGAVRP